MSCRAKLAKLVDSTPIVIIMTIITVYALFFDDIRMMAFPKTYDDLFYGITLGCMIAFALEIILASIGKRGDYAGTFLFWLDVVSTVSMIPDCGWIWDPFINAVTGIGESGGADSATSLAKTSRAGRVTRVIRVIRLIRLIRIVKLYKQAKIAQKKRQEAKERDMEKKKAKELELQ